MLLSGQDWIIERCKGLDEMDTLNVNAANVAAVAPCKHNSINGKSVSTS